MKDTLTNKDKKYPMNVSFWEGKRVLITGGTAGLGKQLTQLLIQMGAHVAIVARGTSRLEEMRKEILPDDSKHLITVQADIGDKSAIHQIFTQVMGQLGEIDVLINNASTLGPTPLRSFLDLQCEELEEIFQVNLFGPFRLIKTVLPSMILSNSGMIVNISSDAAIGAYPTWGGYSISKAAFDHMTKIWRNELDDTGVVMISLDPGDMHTQMHFDAIPDADPSELNKPLDVAHKMLNFLSVQNFVKTRYSATEWRDAL